MFANATAQTCTGTGDSLSMTGLIAGRLPFSASFSDGDAVAYFVEDSGGTIMVSGVGQYVSASDSITRNDMWNYNGTVVDKDPATNIALSAGTHTVRCDADTASLAVLSDKPKSYSEYMRCGALNADWGGSTFLATADRQYATVFQLTESAFISAMHMHIVTADAAGSAQMGLTRCIDGAPDTTYIATATIDITTTGYKEPIINKFLTAGWYFIHIVSNSSVVEFHSEGDAIDGGIGWTPLDEINYSNRHMRCQYYYKDGVTGATLDPNPETVLTRHTPNDRMINPRLIRG